MLICFTDAVVIVRSEYVKTSQGLLFGEAAVYYKWIADCPIAALRYVTYLRHTGVDFPGLNLISKYKDKMLIVCMWTYICEMYMCVK